MRKSGQTWRAALSKALESVDLTLMQWAVLDLVVEQPWLSQVEIARTLGIEGASLVRILDLLESRGWLTRTADAHDRRVKRISFQPQGLSKWEAADAQVKWVHARALSAMSQQDQNELCRLVELMSANLAQP